MNAPKTLKDILGQDLAGFTLAHARGIAMSDNFIAPVVMTESQQPIVCLDDDDLIDLVASRFNEPAAHGRPKVEVIVHVASSTAYWLSNEEPFAAGPMHVLTRDEYERLKDVPDAFGWRKST